MSECDFLQYFNGFLLRYFYRVQIHAREFYLIILRTLGPLQPGIISFAWCCSAEMDTCWRGTPPPSATSVTGRGWLRGAKKVGSFVFINRGRDLTGFIYSLLSISRLCRQWQDPAHREYGTLRIPVRGIVMLIVDNPLDVVDILAGPTWERSRTGGRSCSSVTGATAWLSPDPREPPVLQVGRGCLGLQRNNLSGWVCWLVIIKYFLLVFITGLWSPQQLPR